ncbi:MAG: hypothetical protein ACN2B6_12165, partial [Rickettsiales bacterium]
DAVVEPAQAVVGGAIRQSLAGLGGLASAGMQKDMGQGAETVRRIENAPALDFSPETQMGERGLEVLGDLAQFGIDVARIPIAGLAGFAELIKSGGDVNKSADLIRSIRNDGLGATAGDKMLEQTGSPGLATAAMMAPEAVASVMGLQGARVANQAARTPRRQLMDPESGELTHGFRKELQKRGAMSGEVLPHEVNQLPDVSPKRASQELIRRRIDEGQSDDFLAPYRVEKGKVVDDDLAIEAERQGVPKGDIMAIKSADTPTKRKMAQMLRMHRNIKANSANAEKFRHTDVIGQSLMGRFRYLRDEANKARAELDKIVSSGPKGTSSRLIEGPNAGIRGKAVDLSRIEDTFYKGLDDLNVTYDRSTVPPTLNFKGSIIQENPASKSLIASIVRLMDGEGAPDAVAAHTLKRQLDDLIDFKKKSEGGISESGRRFAKALRHEINEVVRDISPAYRRANDRLHAALTAMDEFDDAMGANINLYAPSAEKVVGTKMRNLLNNYATRGKIEDAGRLLSDTANKLGGEFRDDYARLVNFGKILDDRFGDIARGTFKAETATGTRQGLQQGMRGDIKGMAMDAAASKVADKIQEMRGINDDNAYRAIERMILRDLM